MDESRMIYYVVIVLLCIILFIIICSCHLPLSHFELKFPNKYYIINYANKKTLMPYENNTLVSLFDYSPSEKLHKWKFIPIYSNNNVLTKYFYIFNSGLNMYLTLDNNNNIILNSTYKYADDKAEIIWSINDINVKDKADMASVLYCNIKNISDDIIAEHGILTLDNKNKAILTQKNTIDSNNDLWQIYSE